MHIFQHILASALFFNMFCYAAYNEPKRLNRINPTFLSDVHAVAQEVVQMHACINHGFYERARREYKVYFDKDMRTLHKMRISIEKLPNNPLGNRMLTFKRSPRRKAKEDRCVHQYVYSAICQDAPEYQPMLEQIGSEEKKDLTALIITLFNNELSGVSETVSTAPHIKEKPCIIM